MFHSNRRDFLKMTGAVGAGVGLTVLGGARLDADELSPGDSGADKLGWKLGVQAWTFHHDTLFESIDNTAALGLHYIEAFPGQKLSKAKPNVLFDENAPAEVRAEVRKKLADSDVKLVNFGCCTLSKDPHQCRKMFEFAKDMGIETLVSEPDEEAFDALDKLCEEFKINVAVHNHADPSHYWNPDTVLKVCRGRSKRIGDCADTGHWARSELNPIECLKKLEGRIISFHLKDRNKMGKNDSHDVPWGTGVCDVKGILAEVKRQGIKPFFAIEYEYNWGKSMPELAQCVEFFNETADELAKNKR
ncbi:MAG: TIM barrel protein [Pirellulales bacterium]|nr:TIM barrel protein [Pirellulales bacterium]